MSRLIDNIKRLAGMVKNETKSGGNTAARIGGLFEEIAAELEEKYDKTESDIQASEHNTDAEAHKNIQERIDTVLDNLNRDKLDKTGDGSNVSVIFNEAVDRTNVESGDTLAALLGKVRKWFAGLQTVAFSGKTADLTDDMEHRLTTDTEKARWNNTYTKKETDDKDTAVQNAVDNLAGDVYRKAETESRDAEVLKSAKEYADGKVTDLGGDTYRKSETYNRTEIDSKDSAALKTAKEYADNQVSGLGNEVYRKTETYNRGEISTLNDGVLALAKEYARQLRNDLVNGAGEAMDTLFELSNALNNDPNFATTIMTLIAGKADSWHTHTKSQITDFPTSMPASDVYAWAKASTKPSYTAAEVGAAAAGHNHDSVYQPKGSYAAASHKHAATDVTEDSTHRFMTDAERTKLNGIEAGANKYVHPSSHSADMITDSTTKVMMTAAERSKLAGLNSFEIKEISNFNEATSTGFYAVFGNAAGGPKPNDPSFADVGCLKVFCVDSPVSGSTELTGVFKLMEFTVKNMNSGTTFYFIKFLAKINSTAEDWVQVIPAEPTTSIPVPSPTD